MSKADDLRRLREERYARGGAPAAPQEKVAALKQAVRKIESGERDPVGTACGHTAIGGKTCIRPAGHSEKSHRYVKTAKP